MNHKSTLLALALLAVLAAGAWWARSPTSSVPASMHPASGDDDLPDVTFAAGVVGAGGVRITLVVTPNPPVALEKTRVRVRADANGSPVAIENGRVSFEMVMPMGDHRYTLVPGEDGWLEAEAVLPRCMSGKRRWYATVEGTVAGQPRTARFRFDLAPPN
jgi:hypothetical protein